MAAALWATAAGLAAWERRASPRAADEPPLADGPLVSAIVPARDEERGIAAAIRSLRAQRYPRLEVIVVDDESRDGTRARATEAAGADPRVRVVAGRPLPPGWVGKSWACWQGAGAASGEWLLFTDADVEHGPEAVGRALALAERLGRGGVTLAPRVELGSVPERVVMPAAVAAIQALVAPGPLARSGRSPVAVAAGGFMLVRRDLYDRIGGHRAVADRIVEDLGLAALVKRAGALMVPASGNGLVGLRMYHGGREMWRGWRKNASFGTAGGPGKALVGAVLVGVMAAAPPLAAVAGWRRGDRALAGVGLAGWAAQTALQRLVSDLAPTPARYAPTLPAGAVVLAAAAARGSLERLTGRGPDWRGRRYPAAR